MIAIAVIEILIRLSWVALKAITFLVTVAFLNEMSNRIAIYGYLNVLLSLATFDKQ